MSAILRVTAFVDWDTARRLAAADFRLGRSNLALRSFAAFQLSLAALLTEAYPQTAIRVALRIYHGWYRGKTKATDRVEFEQQVISDIARARSIVFHSRLKWHLETFCFAADADVCSMTR